MFGNPNCHPFAQNCESLCCTYNRGCPEDWAALEACFYPYYNYSEGLPLPNRVGVIVTVVAFLSLSLSIGIYLWWKKHSAPTTIVKT